MCLAIPGKLIEIVENDDSLLRTGKVSYEGIIKQVSLAWLPEAKINDYVLIHVGAAISIIDELEANKIYEIYNGIS